MARANATILCIDQHWSGLIARKIFLEQNGYKVLEATDPVEGMRLFLSNRVDAVLVDYHMPGMSGDIVASKMKLLKPEVPIMLLSAYGPLPKKKLKSVNTLLSGSQPPTVLLSALRDMLTGWSKPFFHRWIDQWKSRNLGVRP